MAAVTKAQLEVVLERLSEKVYTLIQTRGPEEIFNEATDVDLLLIVVQAKMQSEIHDLSQRIDALEELEARVNTLEMNALVSEKEKKGGGYGQERSSGSNDGLDVQI